MQVKVYDKISNIERTVTKKAYDIINRGRKQRYQLISYLDDEGNPTEQQVQAPTITAEKKTEQRSEVVQAAADSGHPAFQMTEVKEGITVIRKKPGPKPKSHAKE